jgi:hypothetical protein
MAIETATEQLERVQAAIRKIETGGQTVEIDGKRLTRADLKLLYEREATLKREIAAASRGGRIIYGVGC